MKLFSRRATLTSVLLTIGCLIPVLVDGQSFDCRKAATSVEHAICKDDGLKELDIKLARELKYAEAAQPEHRKDLISEQRRWLIMRNKQCLGAEPEFSGQTSDCLANLYGTRISELSAASRDGAVKASTAICRKLFDRYKPLAGFSAGGSPIHVLRKAQGSGVFIADSVGVSIGADDSLADWVKHAVSVDMDDDLAKTLDSNGIMLSAGIGTLERLPNTDFYVLDVVQGTGYCHSPVYFQVAHGRARAATDPPGFGGDDVGACLVARNFGLVDDVPVYIEEAGASIELNSEFKVASWIGDRFAGACKVEIEYAPGFTTEANGNWQNVCEGADCDTLKGAAYKFATSVQKNTERAVVDAGSALSPEQKAEFGTIVKLLNDRDRTEDASPTLDPGAILDMNPLRLPFIIHSHIYVASIGHFTIGWRQSLDWSVVFETVENGAIVTKAQFGVGMFNDTVTDVSITSIP